MFLKSFLALAYFAVSAQSAALFERATARTSPPSGSKVVRKTGTQTGEYNTIQKAIDSLGSGTASASIFIYGGTYNEQVTIKYGGPLTIYGYTTDVGNWKGNQVTIQHTLNSATAGSLDNSATFRTSSNNFKLYNVNIRNNYGQGAQAVALSARGDKQGYYGCAFYSYQDTLYAVSNKQYYSNCYIEGAVDYIFGGAAAWFGECTIASNGGGAITANSREVSSDPGWYVIDSSTVTSAANSGDLTAKVYLGRPWRVLARVIYQKSSLSAIIAPKGWTEMAAGATPLYYEYGNTGAGAGTSQRQYLKSISAPVDKATLFGSDWTVWIDRSY